MSQILDRIPRKYCHAGKHFYLEIFAFCPEHAGTLYNVRLQTHYYCLKKPDGSRTNDWTFQQRSDTPKHAVQQVLVAIFGLLDQESLMRYIKNIEVYKASVAGIPDSEIWRGGAQ